MNFFIVGFVIVVLLLVVLGIVFKVKSNSGVVIRRRLVLIGLPTFFVVLGGVCSFYVFKYLKDKENFRSFDLSELKKQEFIIQTIEFNKFIIQGTENNGTSQIDKYTDEMQVYLVSGHADVSFTDIDHLRINEAASDINTKVLRLDYENAEKNIPFSINVVINEEDIYKVAQFESEPIKFLGFNKDLILPEMSTSEKIESVKEDLKGEFEKQILQTSEKLPLAEMDVYQSFIKRITDVITGISDWETVDILFVSK